MTVYVVDANGQIKTEAIALLVIFACLFLDIVFGYLYPASSAEQAASVEKPAEAYRAAAQKQLKEAVIAKKKTDEELLDAKACLQKAHSADTEALTGAEQEARKEDIDRAIDNVQIAAAEEQRAEDNVDKAAQRLVQIDTAEARWESFLEWQQGLKFSLQHDDQTMDKTDLRNYLQAPERRWKFAGKQHTEDDLDGLFDKMDKNHDGIITAEEFMEYFLGSKE